MDRRIHQRFPANVSVKVTDLVTRESVSGTLVDISTSGVCVLLQDPFAVESILKLDVADSVLFGSVVHCTGDKSPFRLGVEVVRVLIGGTDLANLLKAVLVEALPGTPGLAVSRR